jgi:large subunit ribosomal protein L32
MAVPKYKTSKKRTRTRRSANMKLAIPGLVECGTCGNKVLPHRVCPKSGTTGEIRLLNLKTWLKLLF